MTLIFSALLPEAVLAIHKDEKYDIGNHVPGFELSDLSGKTHIVDWKRIDRGAVAVVFFEMGTAESFREISYLNSLHSKASNYGMEIYAIEGSGLKPEEVDEAFERYRKLFPDPSFPIVSDEDYALSTFFRIQRLPTTLLMESHGVVVSRSENFSDYYAIDFTRSVERVLKVEKGHFSFALRDQEISAEDERQHSEFAAAARLLRSGPRRSATLLTVGEQVPAFEYKSLKGIEGRWDPALTDSGVTIVFFWGALCLPCIKEMAYLDTIYRKIHDYGLNVLAVEASGLAAERAEAVIDRYRRFHPDPAYTVIPDPDMRINRIFGIGGKIPATFFIDGEGTVSYFTDEFIQGHEQILADKIEFALRLEGGTLGKAEEVVRMRYLQESGEGEAPSVEEARAETFRSSRTQGDAYYLNWQFDEALPHYLRALDLRPEEVTVRERVAEIYQRQGKLTQAAVEWERVLELSPNNFKAREALDILSTP